MKRWAWNILCALSLLVFATTMTLCVRSYFVSDRIQYNTVWTHETAGRTLRQRQWYTFVANRGSLAIGHVVLQDAPATNIGLGWEYEGAQYSPGPLFLNTRASASIFSSADSR